MADKDDESANTVEKGDKPPSYDATDNKESESPPAYDTVMAKIQHIKDSAKDKKESGENLCSFFFCGTVGLTLTITITIAIPIASIVYGDIYWFDCPAQPMIPVYLVVCGCIGLTKALLAITEIIHKKRGDIIYHRPKVFTCCDGPIACFILVWFIAGNIWIFRLHGHYQSTDPTLSTYCNNSLYLFAYWVTVVGYIILLFCICLLCAVGYHVKKK